MIWYQYMQQNIEIIHETDSYLCINKPTGLVVHSDGKTSESSVVDWILATYPHLQGVGEPMKLSDGTSIDRPGIVHRLDRETSGVMLIAKTQEAFEYFKKLFQDHAVQKTYHAFVYGHLKEDKGIIDKAIGRSSQDFRKWSAQRGARGVMREAITHYRVIERTEDNSGEKVTFIELKPITGRTHQIRVHMKAVHHPVIADSLYAPNQKKLLSFKRTALHAREIVFTDQNGNLQTYRAEYPEDFKNAVDLVSSK